MNVSHDGLPEIPEWSPVILTVYNRPEHFRTCVTSLQANQGANQTTLYISSDGPKSPKDVGEVEKVRQVIQEISGFKEIVVFAPSENTQGKIKAQVVAEVKARHAAYIFAEDDIFFAPDFLTFVNSGLRAFAGNQEILAVCGYLYPDFPVATQSQLYLKCFTAWGYGTWSDRAAFSERQAEVAREIFSNKTLFHTASKHLPHTIRLSREILRGNLVAGDITACNRLFIEEKFCIFPPATLVKNMGFDGSGEHCKQDLTYSRQKITTESVLLDPEKPVERDVEGQKFLYKTFGGRVFTTLNNLIFLEYQTPAGAMRTVLTRFNDLTWGLLLGSYSLLRTLRNAAYQRK